MKWFSILFMLVVIFAIGCGEDRDEIVIGSTTETKSGLYSLSVDDLQIVKEAGQGQNKIYWVVIDITIHNNSSEECCPTFIIQSSDKNAVYSEFVVQYPDFPKKIKPGGTVRGTLQMWIGRPEKGSYVLVVDFGEEKVSMDLPLEFPEERQEQPAEPQPEPQPEPQVPIPQETLEIKNLKAEKSLLNPGETTTIEVSVSYSGDTAVLMYRWAAEVGSIIGTGKRVNYIAPPVNPGSYSISVTVTDGLISAEKTIGVTVDQQFVDSLILARNTYWPALAHKDKLAYDVRITSLVGGKVLLYYDITQDQDKLDAFLSIQINEKVILAERAIGNVLPSTGIRTMEDINLTNVITGPGRYIITFYIRPGDRAKNGWLLNEAKLIGIKGTSDPQQ